MVKQIGKYLLCMLFSFFLAGAAVAGAVDPQEIQTNIDAAKAKQQQAHAIAEYVRSFGEADTHPAIQFAQEKWSEQRALLDELYQQYQEAVEQEDLERERQAQLEALQKEQEALQRERGTYIGKFRISHYCPCVACNGGYGKTAVGSMLSPWYTLAVDPSVIPLNSMVYIDGYGTFQAQDTGGAIHGNRIDVCVSNHAEAMRLGVVYRDVYIK